MVALSFAALPEAPDAEAHSLYNVRLVAQNSGKCLDIVGGNPAPLTKTHQWSCGGWPEYPGGVVPWQQWDIIQVDSTWHIIKNRYSQLCLDVYGGTSEDVQLHQWTCNYTDAQKFTAPSCVGCWSEMINKASNKCVDVYGAGIGDGVIILQTTCNGTRAQQWSPDNHSPEKRLFTDRWYQRVEDSGSYPTWMTLTGHRHYEGSTQNVWATPITNALNGYNTSSQPGGIHTVFITDFAPAYWHDIHTWVTQDGCVTDTYSIPSTGQQENRQFCTSAFGQIFLLDEGFHDCPSGDCDSQHSWPNTWWFVTVVLNEQTHINQGEANPWFRQATAAHELGHAINLRHDYSPADGEARDGICGNLPVSIMDADCIFNNVTNSSQAWDACGINHAYNDPNWGWSGC